jgi:hypothetical protein
MQKWEYLFISYNRILSSGGSYQTVYTENGVSVPYDENKGEAGIANVKGSEGWELVSYIWDGHWRMVFKRPKS